MGIHLIVKSLFRLGCGKAIYQSLLAPVDALLQYCLMLKDISLVLSFITVIESDREESDFSLLKGRLSPSHKILYRVYRNVEITARYSKSWQISIFEFNKKNDSLICNCYFCCFRSRSDFCCWKFLIFFKDYIFREKYFFKWGC